MPETAFKLHPDMAILIAAKEDAARIAASGDHRRAWDVYGASMQRPYPLGMSVSDTIFDIGQTRQGGLPARIYRPRSAPQTSPCILYLHGGAFVKGTLDSGDAIAWGISDRVGVVVVSIDYRLAPEHPFPAALYDCQAAVGYIVSHSTELKIDPSRVALWGDSAGGNLATATSLLTSASGSPPVVALAIHYPCLTDEFTSPAYVTHAESPGLRTDWMNHCWNLYLAGDRPTRNPLAAPLKADNFSNFPSCYVHIAEIDPLADDGRQFAEMLKRAGRDVTFSCAEGMIHGFLRARFFGPAAEAEFEKSCSFLRRKLGCEGAS